jgi:hypothetical protein
MYTLNDNLIRDFEKPEGYAWFQFLSLFRVNYKSLTSLKRSISNPRNSTFSMVPFQRMLKEALETRPFSAEVLQHYIGLNFGPGDETDAIYGLMERAYQYLFEDGTLEQVGDYITETQKPIRRHLEMQRKAGTLPE